MLKMELEVNISSSCQLSINFYNHVHRLAKCSTGGFKVAGGYWPPFNG